MSNSLGAVKFKDGIIKYYEYGGTADVVTSHLYDSSKEVNDNWRKHEWLKCKCEQGEEFVSIYTDYGGGFYITGEGCKNCNSLHQIRGCRAHKYDEGDPYIEVDKEAVNDWARELPEFKSSNQQQDGE